MFRLRTHDGPCWRLSYPAIASGFTDRGWIKERSPADIIVYDYDGLDLVRLVLNDSVLLLTGSTPLTGPDKMPFSDISLENCIPFSQFARPQ
jgi:hypothetical protein